MKNIKWCNDEPMGEQEPVACIVDGELYWSNEIDWEELQGIPLYTSPQYRELSYGELGELYVQAQKESFGMARIKPDGGISLRPDLVKFAELIEKAILPVSNTASDVDQKSPNSSNSIPQYKDLTDEEIDKLAYDYDLLDDYSHDFVRACIKKAQEK